MRRLTASRGTQKLATLAPRVRSSSSTRYPGASGVYSLVASPSTALHSGCVVALEAKVSARSGSSPSERARVLLEAYATGTRGYPNLPHSRTERQGLPHTCAGISLMAFTPNSSVTCTRRRDFAQAAGVPVSRPGNSSASAEFARLRPPPANCDADRPCRRWRGFAPTAGQRGDVFGHARNSNTPRQMPSLPKGGASRHCRDHHLQSAIGLPQGMRFVPSIRETRARVINGRTGAARWGRPSAKAAPRAQRKGKSRSTACRFAKHERSRRTETSRHHARRQGEPLRRLPFARSQPTSRTPA